MDDATAWTIIASERRALADELEALTDEQWQRPSLCGAWNVAQVATHVMVGPTGSLLGFATAMVQGRGSFDRANEVMVARRMSRPRQMIVDDLRTHAGHRFTPPGFDWHAPLTDLMLHRLDIMVPLDRDGAESDARQAAWPDVLDFLLSPKAAGAFGTKGLPELSYRATDVDWAAGNGPLVEGTAGDLALAVSRRPARTGRLTGAGAATLARWAEA